MTSQRSEILKLHKIWADRITLLWQLFVLLLFGTIYFLLDQGGITASDRTDALLILTVMVLITAIWQAVGFGIARIHMLMQGLDLRTATHRAQPTGGNRF